mgnify:FL=1
MAGFAIDIGAAGSEYEQGVSAPSATSTDAAASGLAMIGKGLFGAMDAQARANKPPSESAVNRQLYAGLSQDLDNTKGLDPLQQRTKVNAALSKFTNQGGELGKAETDLVMLKTGINVESLTFNPQQAAINAAVQKLQENPAYLSEAEKTLKNSGKPYTQDEVIATAMADVQKQEAAALYVANAKNVSIREFRETYLPQANVALDGVRKSALAGLFIETEGGNVSPESIVQLRTKFDIVKAQFTKPELVPADEWQGLQAQIDTLDNLLTTLESYDENVLTRERMEALEPISAALINQAKELSKTDPILAKALLDPKTDFSTYIASKLSTLTKTLQNVSAEETVYTDIDVDVFGLAKAARDEEQARLDRGEIIVTELPPARNLVSMQVDDLHDPDEIVKAEELSDADRKNGLDFATTMRIRSTTPEGIAKPEERENFLNGIGKATVNISTSPRIIDRGTMSSIYNEDTYAKLKVAKTYDPEAASLATERLKDGLVAQFNAVTTAASGSLQGSNFKIVGVGKVEFDFEGAAEKAPFNIDRNLEATLNSFSSKRYNSVSEMIADRGRKLTAFERGQINAVGFDINAAYRDYYKVLKQSNSMKFYIDNLRKLGVDTKQAEELLVKPITQTREDGANLGTLKNPFPIQWSDDTDIDDKLFASLDVGDYFTGPDGSIMVKERN